MVVVDTNILAYLLISGDRTREARRLYEHDPEWRSEAFLLIEFSNLLATYVRLDRLSHAKSEKVLEEAESRIHGLVRLPHLQVLRVAHRFKVSAKCPSIGNLGRLQAHTIGPSLADSKAWSSGTRTHARLDGGYPLRSWGSSVCDACRSGIFMQMP